jgi:hypothetical protein
MNRVSLPDELTAIAVAVVKTSVWC